MEESREGIHQARTNCKRARAIVRLLKEFAPSIFEREDSSLKEMAHSLSEMRDAHVQKSVLNDVIHESKNGTLFSPLNQLLCDTENASVDELSHDKMLCDLTKKASEVEERLEALDLDKKLHIAHIKDALRTSYRRCRKSMLKACAQPQEEHFHDWRKRTKNLTYQIDTVKKLCSKALKRVRKKLAKLGDILGKEHDLAVLREVILQKDCGSDLETLRESFVEYLEPRLFDLKGDARKLRAEIFAQKPKAFINFSAG